MLTIRFGQADWGRVRFAAGPAPVLETVLMLFELRSRPRLGGGARDWRAAVRSAMPEAAKPLWLLVPTRKRALYLDVLTPDADEAFHLVRETPRSVHSDNLRRIENVRGDPTPLWLSRYADRDPATLDTLDRALRAFHTTFLAHDWPAVTTIFHNDVAHRTTTFRQQGLTTMINALSPDIRLHAATLTARYPYRRHVDLGGAGLVLMPSAFWTGHPLITWNPQDQSQHVLVYPAHRGQNPLPGPDSGDSVGALVGRTRAVVLRALHEPHTTTSLARCVGISVSSASEHAAALRRAGLITSHRQGQAMRHELTPLGQSLLISPP